MTVTIDDQGRDSGAATVQRRAGRPSREEALAIEALILDGTIDAMRDARYATLSIDALAQDIGVTKQTIYRRFPSKDALIDAAIRRKMDQLHAFARDTASAAADPIESLRAFARHMFDMMRKPENVGLSIFIDHASLTDVAFARRRQQWHVMLMEPMKTAIATAQAQARLAPGDVEVMANMLFDLLAGPVNRMRYCVAPDTALGGMCEDRAFSARFDVFLRLYALPPDCCAAIK
ncbi:TetR/AcrR family transcriptional regulator [Sphingomonas sp. RIT328]|uniref:TetR/AcrR family transcriptional regulator n=1 Tax=Sphingomonas sp. RIT328 TaxID=1470591 RepID=UPI00044680E5|nr:TetR/AcrR family transcriptional regulator [Sphingomonas sp. RIT328]EZP52228.1 Bacterial regulatory s, tetR family protein [Sphingomonas sp. RIT328]